MSGDLGNSYNIDIWGLLIALGMVAVAAIISELMHMGIGKTLMWSSCRALVQLCAMGFIIGYVIRSNNVWMVFSLMAVMLVAAVQIVMSRARGIPKGLAGPIFLSLVITMLLMLALLLILKKPNSSEKSVDIKRFTDLEVDHVGDIRRQGEGFDFTWD